MGVGGDSVAAAVAAVDEENDRLPRHLTDDDNNEGESPGRVNEAVVF